MSNVSISLEEIKRMTNAELFIAAVEESMLREGYQKEHKANVEALVGELMWRSSAARAPDCYSGLSQVRILAPQPEEG
jgi:hypothetical protein